MQNPILHSLYLKDELSDVEITVKSQDGYTWRFPAHSLILKSASEVLRERLEEDHSETKRLTFIDIEPKVVVLLLRFLYVGDLPPISSQLDLVHLHSLAVKFRIVTLEMECENRILRSLKVTNVCGILNVENRYITSGYGSTKIKDACIRLLLDYAQIVFSSDMVLELCREDMATLLASDHLNTLSEDIIFQGLWRWGRFGCYRAALSISTNSIIQHLNDLLGCIRYSLIEKKQQIPEIVLSLYSRCETVPRGCCWKTVTAYTKERCKYRQPRNLLHQCTRLDLSKTKRVRSKYFEELERRFLCCQISFEEDVFLEATVLEITSGGEEINSTTDEDTFALAVCAELPGGQELIRQEVHWDDIIRNSNEALSYTSTVIFSVPVKLNRSTMYSFRLQRYSSTSDSKETNRKKRWMIPSTHIEQEVIPLNAETNITVHGNHLSALSALYVITGVQTLLD